MLPCIIAETVQHILVAPLGADSDSQDFLHFVMLSFATCLSLKSVTEGRVSRGWGERGSLSWNIFSELIV